MNAAVLIPCFNEEMTIGKVIDGFKNALPDANIYVYDNNSNDRTSKIALEHGAIVKREYRQGKGNVVRSMFRDINADYYIMVDGDDTYPAEFANRLIEPLITGEADMTIGDRLSNGTYYNQNKRAFHDAGNGMVRWLINMIFKSNVKDIMTGYRGFNKDFVKAMPILSSKFEVETEMSIHALDKKFLIKEVAIEYRDRPKGSKSKLNTFSDGFKVLKTIFMLFKDYKPLLFFSLLSLIFLIVGLLIGIPVFIEFGRTRFIRKLPSAIMALGFVLLSMNAFICGVILDTVVKHCKADYELHMNIMRDSFRGKK